MASPHNPMLDEQGRVWMTQPIRPGSPQDLPAWTKSAIATETNDPAELELAYKLRQSRGNGMQLGFFDTKTGKFKDYPLPPPGRVSHGADFSTDGMLWFSAGSGHLGRFDPKTEKFTYWDLPGPKYPGTGRETGSVEYPYFLYVDQFNTLGLGKDMVVVTGTTSDSLQIFDPKQEAFVVFRLPYPMPFYTRGLDGRIDNAERGWKGRGLWASYSSYMPVFTETKMGSLNHIQIRPNPLAD